MLNEISPDQFDEVRREWIARHAGVFTIQKRRAEILNRHIRDRHRKLAGARPNPHDDNVIKPLPARRADTVEGYVEAAIVAVAALLAPIGWPAGFTGSSTDGSPSTVPPTGGRGPRGRSPPTSTTRWAPTT